MVLTTAEVAGAACGTVLIDDAHEARVAWSDGRVALLRPERRLAPMRVAAVEPQPARLGSAVAVAGFPFGGALDRASLTFGRLEDLRGLSGEETLDRYALQTEAGDAGGPVLARDGSVTGLLLPAGAGSAARALPDGGGVRRGRREPDRDPAGGRDRAGTQGRGERFPFARAADAGSGGDDGAGRLPQLARRPPQMRQNVDVKIT